VKDEIWQLIRIKLKGKSLNEKYHMLLNYLISRNYSRKSKVQVTNYITALSRGGIIHLCDYREEVDNYGMDRSTTKVCKIS
ncbi:MAG: hypothetical protein KKC55_17390, partial [Gammaproteobacteria bacterium]|nr:hypothetical protein [Gammaproteobacteria bacterium]